MDMMHVSKEVKPSQPEGKTCFLKRLCQSKSKRDKYIKDFGKEKGNKLANARDRHELALQQKKDYKITEEEIKEFSLHLYYAGLKLKVICMCYEHLKRTNRELEFNEAFNGKTTVKKFCEAYEKVEGNNLLVYHEVFAKGKKYFNAKKFYNDVMDEYKTLEDRYKIVSKVWTEMKKEEEIKEKEKVRGPERTAAIEREKAVYKLYLTILRDERERSGNEELGNTFRMTDAIDVDHTQHLESLRLVNQRFREFVKRNPDTLRSKLEGLVQAGQEILGTAKEYQGNDYAMSRLGRNEKQRFNQGVTSLGPYLQDTVPGLLKKSDSPDLDGMVKALETLTLDSSKLNHINNRLREIEESRALFSDDPTKRKIAIEKAVMDRYLSVYQKQEQQDNIESFAKHLEGDFGKHYTLAQEINSGKREGSLDTIREINKTFREAAEKSPEQFRRSLEKEGETARTLYEWASSFTERFELGESWVKTAMEKKLGVNKDNFEKSYEELRELLGHSRLSQFLDSTTAVSDIVSGGSNRQAYEADSIVQDYEGLIRAIAGFKYIHSLFKDGIPVDGIPKQIKDRKVIGVSGEGNDCLPRSLLTGAHPDWSPELIEKHVGEARSYVVTEYGEKTKRYQKEVKKHKKQMQDLRKQGEGARLDGVEHQLAQEEIYDIENPNVARWDQLNLGGDAGQILLDYLRSTRVTDPIKGGEVYILEPDRAILWYEYRDGKILCFEQTSGDPNKPPYAVLRNHYSLASGHYYAIQDKPSE